MDTRVMARPARVLSGMAQAEGYKNPVVLWKCSDRSQCLGVSIQLTLPWRCSGDPGLGCRK